MKTTKAIVALTIAALAASCGTERQAQPDGADGEGPDVEATGPQPAETVSILRPDVEQPEAPPEELRTLNVTVGFPEGGSELDEEALAALRLALASEQLALGLPVTLRGHSDAGGSDAANERASQARAEAVRDWLVDNGVSEDRIRVIAFGEQNPIEPNALPDGSPNEAGRAANRRVEVEIPTLAVDAEATNDDSAEAGD